MILQISTEIVIGQTHIYHVLRYQIHGTARTLLYLRKKTSINGRKQYVTFKHLNWIWMS